MIRYFDTKNKPWLVWVGFALIGLALALMFEAAKVLLGRATPPPVPPAAGHPEHAS